MTGSREFEKFDDAISGMMGDLRRRLQEVPPISVKQVGEIEEYKDGVVVVLNFNVGIDEAVRFRKSGDLGLVMSLEEDGSAGVVVLSNASNIKPGDLIERTGEVLQVPVGDSLLGRVIDPLGNAIDGKGEIRFQKKRKIERLAPGVIDRQQVNRPVQTGIKAVDGLIPIGRGQRELIIGDRGTGKTTLAVDTIINQRGKDLTCIYVAIGKKTSELASIAEVLERAGALEHTIIVSATASMPASLQYVAPFSGCAIGEEIMESGRDALIVYDDLTKHAQAYRQISLLLRRPSGREAYPGDIFYLHSRLLERSARLSAELGGGSLTALPIIETQEGDVSSYIPTNVISITDGQIYLQTDLFNSGIRPAIDIGLSVSRVGSVAQERVLRRAVGSTKITLAQYAELSKFVAFAGDLDKSTRDQLTRGQRIAEVLKQAEHRPFPLAHQVAIFYAANKGELDLVPIKEVAVWENNFLGRLDGLFPEIRREIEERGELTDDLKAGLDKVFVAK